MPPASSTGDGLMQVRLHHESNTPHRWRAMLEAICVGVRWFSLRHYLSHVLLDPFAGPVPHLGGPWCRVPSTRQPPAKPRAKPSIL